MNGDTPPAASTEEKARVFVSGTSGDLETARERLAAALREAGFEAEVQPEFGAQAAIAVHAMLSAKIERCSHVVHLVGFRLGCGPPLRQGAPAESYTQMEARLAVELGKPLFVFLLPESFPFDAAAPESPEAARRQLEYRAEIVERGAPLYNRAADIAELEQVACAAIQRDVREAAARRRESAHLTGCLPPYPENPAFIRREEALRRLNSIAMRYAAGERVRAVVLAGLGGIGKTNLALYHARRFERQLRPPLWLRADSPQMLARELARLAGSDGFHLRLSDEISEPEKVRLVLQALREKGV
jgi:hypothetical protein